jgi:hypothetical protein
MIAGLIFETNSFGKCEVISYGGCFDVSVRFINTGYQCTTTSDQLRKGTVRDRSVPTICGVGYLGDKVDYIPEIYTRWVNMIKRCYDPEVQKLHPTYIGCTVCDEWLCYSNYFKWVSSQNYKGLEIDKDRKVKGNKVYSPDNCEIITLKENMQEAFCKNYLLIHKNGESITIRNMSSFCLDKGLCRSKMHMVMTGKRKSHKGWVSVSLLNERFI